MKTYWNDEYCAPQINFETFRKSREIAQQLSVVLRDSVVVVDPADVPSALAKANVALRDGVDPQYLSAIMTGNPTGLAASNGLGWDDGVYPMVLNSTAGILAATDDVLAGDKVSCSLSSGLHHARRNIGRGYCTVNSLALGALYAADKGAKVVILDLDAHCGGGTAEYIKGTKVRQVDLSVDSFDSYESDDNSSLFLSHDPLTYGDEVAKALDAVDGIGPDVVFYNAGVDVFPHIDAMQVVDREVAVASRLRELGVRTVLVMAGGYGKYEDIVPMHIATIGAFAAPEQVARGMKVAREAISKLAAL